MQAFTAGLSGGFFYLKIRESYGRANQVKKWPLVQLRDKGPVRCRTIFVHQSSHLWLRYAARKPENNIIPRTAIKIFILPNIVNAPLSVSFLSYLKFTSLMTIVAMTT
ncbi:hypothetical protein CIT292_07199 [Citrobacter youngae ATCC 29220]|uniref:Uncharacterized protein n=1 Tax=Citrobacter youngae ATCC 29220 TaxID=500640 RepID=D4B9Q9_9ENTR|nr:hypothetical protein CIT292_07199 [Citrobacter youngae ATCC 29220]